jgi:ketosteroid isomerase-like protein
MLRHGIRLSVSIVTFFLGLALSFVPASFSCDATRVNVYEGEVLEANRQYLDAHIKRDVDALDRLLADDFVIGGRFGRVTGKAQRLALLRNSDFSFLDINDINSGDARVTAGENYGEVSGCAVLRGDYAGQEYASPPYRYTRRFERRDGRWQVVGVETSRGCGH